jgi:hypothetical protein
VEGRALTNTFQSNFTYGSQKGRTLADVEATCMLAILQRSRKLNLREYVDPSAMFLEELHHTFKNSVRNY